MIVLFIPSLFLFLDETIILSNKFSSVAWDFPDGLSNLDCFRVRLFSNVKYAHKNAKLQAYFLQINLHKWINSAQSSISTDSQDPIFPLH